MSTLQDRVHSRRYPKGAVIMRQGAPADGILLVVRGRLRLRRLADGGRTKTVRVLGRGECFCLAPLHEDIPSPVTAECVTESVISLLRSDQLAPVLSAAPAYIDGVVRCLSEQLAASMRETVEAPLRPVRQRVAGSLARLAAQMDPDPGDGIVLTGITHEELASLAGTVREVASRTLSALEKKGILRTGRGRITILDLERLEGAAAPLSRSSVK
jgi:CRP-like cAMP-binding protein